jgi:glyoxylase-like metal-dependent hydrolase (beta-lactamase superfamily II)
MPMPLSFTRDFAPRHCEAVEVAPGVRRITASNPGPFTFHGTNTFLIGRDELAVLDPGPADPAHIEAIVHAIGDARVRHILVSHTHRDHSPGARLLQAEVDAPILAEGPHRPARPISAGMVALDAGGDLDFTPDALLADGAAIESSSYRLEAVATPGHAANHLAFAFAGTDILFSGDHVMGWATTVVAPPDGSMGDYMASLEKLLARPETLYLPAHGGAVENARDYVRALRSQRRMRERAILQRLAEGDRTIPQIVGRIYSDIDPALHGAAALSTLAQLHDLVERNLVLSDGAPSLVARYSLGGLSASSVEDGIGTTSVGPSGPSCS